MSQVRAGSIDDGIGFIEPLFNFDMNRETNAHETLVAVSGLRRAPNTLVTYPGGLPLPSLELKSAAHSAGFGANDRFGEGPEVTSRQSSRRRTTMAIRRCLSS